MGGVKDIIPDIVMSENAVQTELTDYPHMLVTLSCQESFCLGYCVPRAVCEGMITKESS